MSTAEVFENVPLGLVASMGTLGIFIYAQGMKDDNIFGPPSWVCNWSHECYLGLELYTSNAPSGHRFEFQSTDRESGSLDLWGLEVDSISAVGSNFEDFGSVHELTSQVEEWQKLKGPRTADTGHAVLRTVLLDITHYLHEERRLLPEDFQIIEVWWHWIESLGMRINATDVPKTFPTKEIRDYRVAFTHNAANGSIIASSQGLLVYAYSNILEKANRAPPHDVLPPPTLIDHLSPKATKMKSATYLLLHGLALTSYASTIEVTADVNDVVGGVAIHTPPNAILTTSEQQGTNGTPSLTVAKPYTSIGLVDFWFGCSAHTSESVANLATQCSVTVAAYQSPSDKQVAVAVFEFTPPAVSVSSVPMIQASLPSEFLLSGIKNITIVQDDPTTEALLVDSITYYLSK
ncbi:MAG: hypothetical protein ASARMPREDX12_002842 [Alectoria sarmentosa]|nr:MAG: hypothetical protein ASARMPREDX12_002842 [Alectoria sarmentosa]